MKRIFTVQDISCLGKCSLTVALPVVSAMGVEAAIIPTAVLSTHTMFKGFTCKDLDDQILPIAEHWKKEKFKFDGIYTGYLASAGQIEKVIKLIDGFRDSDTLVAVDPAMADNGKLYPAFDREFPKEMAKLCAVADVILPNMTEAAFLTGGEYKEDYSDECVEETAEKLASAGAKLVILTGVNYKGRYGVYSYDSLSGKSDFYACTKIDASYHGTGDIFSSCFVGGIMRGMSVQRAVRVAADYTAECIRITKEDVGDCYGVEFEKAIPYLIQLIKE